MTNEAWFPMPLGWHRTNGGVRCDMAVGACSCGATHTLEELLPEERNYLHKTRMSEYEEKNMLIDGLFEATAKLEAQAKELEALRKVAEAATHLRELEAPFNFVNRSRERHAAFIDLYNALDELKSVPR